jgi:hypothetical protein
MYVIIHPRYGISARANMTNAWRMPFVIGSIGKLAYGAGAMFAPEWMAEHHLAPTLQGHADPRMSLRGFGGAQSGIALHTLATTTSPQAARTVLRLNILVDTFDAGVSLLEWRARGALDRVVAGGVAVNIAALICWATAAVTLPGTM